MKFLPILLLYLLCFLNGMAQQSIDHLAEQSKNVRYSCEISNPDSVDASIQNLLRIDPSQISNGLYDYYFDLGMAYYTKSFMFKQVEYKPNAYDCFLKCVQIDQTRGDAYHNLLVMYYIDKQIDKAKALLDPYKRYAPLRYRDRKLIRRIKNG